MFANLLTTLRRSVRRGWRQTWSTRATRSESAAVLRLVAASAAAGVPAATMLDAWAEDSRGGQGTRLERMAGLLRQGATAAEAAARVPGTVQDDHAVALAYGERLGLVGPAIQTALAGDDLLDAASRRTLRADLAYVGIVLAIFALVAIFMSLKISPQIERVLAESGVAAPDVFALSTTIGRGIARFFWIPAVLAAAGAVIAFAPAARRVLAAPLARPRRITAALDALAVAAAAGRPVAEAASVLADCQVDRRLAARLARAAGPGPVGTRLAAAGLVTAAEAATLDAAEPAAPAALRRIAAARRARARLRRTVAGRAVMPAAVLVVGGLVLVQGLAVFVTLVELADALS